MTKAKFCITEELLFKFSGSELSLFVLRLNKFSEFLFAERDVWKIDLLVDKDNFITLAECSDDDLYQTRTLLSIFLDSPRSVIDVSNLNESKVYTYYQLSTLDCGHFKQITCKSLIQGFESECGSSDCCRVLSDTTISFSVCRIHNFDKTVDPVLKNLKPIDYQSLEIETFFEYYLKQEFNGNQKEYDAFKLSYMNFHESFDWKSWIPASNPVPAHNILGPLKNYHKSSKEDSYLEKWGYILAFLNGGRFNKALTSLNSVNKKVNNIFQFGIDKGTNTIFFSTDLENGNLEIYNYAGKHLNKIYGLNIGLEKQIKDYHINVPKPKWYS